MMKTHMGKHNVSFTVCSHTQKTCTFCSDRFTEIKWVSLCYMSCSCASELLLEFEGLQKEGARTKTLPIFSKEITF